MNAERLSSLKDILGQAVAAGASDVHLTVESPPLLRVNGQLVRGEGPVFSAGELAGMLDALLSPQHREALEKLGQVDFSYSLSGLGRFRVNVYRQRGSLSAALRVIPTRVPTLEELGLPPVLASLAARPSGLILVTGPAGSGRSTTLAALVDRINRERSCHVVTLEDPIEYLHRHQRSIVNQREIGTDVPSLARALRAVLRQDPDVILIGDLLDAAAVSVALTAAETGRLVLASLNTPNAVQTIERLIDVFPPHLHGQARVQLAGALAAIIAQRLVPRADARGRVAALEILVATPAVRSLIREHKLHQIPSAIETGAKYGMCSMEASLRRLQEDGIVADGAPRQQSEAVAGIPSGQG